MNPLKKLLRDSSPIIDILLALFIHPASFLFKLIRKIGVENLPICRLILTRSGVFPIINHYYEPLFDFANLERDLKLDRELPGIDLNSDEQLNLLNKFKFSNELHASNLEHQVVVDKNLTFSWRNNSFNAGDADFWYNLIRHIKPKSIIEIGSGNSTLLAIKAIKLNTLDDPNYVCAHFCIEPYEMPWLESTDVTLIRSKVETVDKDLFSTLVENDILFIDSSHIIRPQGDVLFEYLELLPLLNPGVIVHIHDIFTPKDYPYDWVVKKVRFWNEQYLLEAFLTNNQNWKVIGALNYLYNHHFDLLSSKCNNLTSDHSPGSFYIQKLK